MRYYNCIKTRDNFIISCDMLRLKFKIAERYFKEFNSFINDLEFNGYLHIKFYESRSYYNYRNLFEITDIKNNCSFALGLGFNGAKKEEMGNCFIEFNPNKCLFDICVIKLILGFFRSVSSGFELVRYDLAIDVPVKRSAVSLVKDLRNYKKNYYLDLQSNSLDNLTEYLGVRNKNGFVKLYNKTLEQKLNYDLTRVEITLDSFDYENMKKHLPKIVCQRQIDFIEYNSLNDTDKVLISLLSESVNANLYLKMLGRVKCEKLSKILFNSVMLDIGQTDYYNLVTEIKNIYI